MLRYAGEKFDEISNKTFRNSQRLIQDSHVDAIITRNRFARNVDRKLRSRRRFSSVADFR